MKAITEQKIKNILAANKNLNFAAKANAIEQALRGRGIDARQANVIARQIVSAN